VFGGYGRNGILYSSGDGTYASAAAINPATTIKLGSPIFATFGTTFVAVDAPCGTSFSLIHHIDAQA